MKILLTALLICFSSCLAMAAEPDFQKIMQDTQRVRQDNLDIEVIWWIPTEYWESVFKANPQITYKQKNKFISSIENIFIFAIYKAKVGPTGAITAIPKDQLKNMTSVIVQGEKLTPLPDTELSDSTRNLLSTMKPVFSKMIGKFGQDTEFFVFNGKNARGDRYDDPKKEGFLTLKLDKKEYQWRLPLGCFLPTTYDPVTGEDFPGNYKYNPFTGSKLVLIMPSKANNNVLNVISNKSEKEANIVYHSSIQSHLTNSFRETISQSSKNPELVMRLTIDSKGKLIQKRFIRSSGDPVFEDSVLRAIDLASANFIPPYNQKAYTGHFLFRPQAISHLSETRGTPEKQAPSDVAK